MLYGTVVTVKVPQDLYCYYSTILILIHVDHRLCKGPENFHPSYSKNGMQPVEQRH